MTEVAIVGMHRSGTSLLTSWLEQCGLTISTGRLMGPGTSNPTGHFEDKDFVDLHARAIRRIAGPQTNGWVVDWMTQGAFSWTERLKAQRLVYQRHRYPVWGWKDPRTILFLDQWTSLCPRLQVIAVWRGRNEVVESLIRRSENPEVSNMAKTTESRAIRMWQGHNQILCDFIRSNPERSVLFAIDTLLSEPQRVFGKISQNVSDLEYSALEDTYRPHLISQTAGSASDPIEAELRKLEAEI